MTDTNEPTFIVGIGASAGGLKPIEEFFDHMRPDSGFAFVVVQHLSPDFKSLMSELLSRHTKMPIHKVSDGITIEPNSIYLIPPKKTMVMSEGKLLLTDKSATPGLHLPIDTFFHSLAQDAQERGVAIIMSGTGSDGSRGVKAIHEKQGLVIVQTLETVGFDGMPRAAISSGVVDLICDPQDMPQRIIDYSNNKDRRPLQQTEFRNENSIKDERLLFRIFRMYREKYNLDFSLYKPATITRRLERRVHLSGASNLLEYLNLLEGDAKEADDLYRDLLVEVTHFFRDPDAFKRMRELVIPDLINRSDPNLELRIWVSGCATGEEAYSIAILIAEGLSRVNRSQKFKVFATDVHRKSLEIASAGVYSSHVLETVPPDLHKYFVKNGSICNVGRAIRHNVIFAANDLTRDPPFTRLDLITCRNVLIYLDPQVQTRILSMFHFGLRVGGVLFLGPSETVGKLSDEFDCVDRHWRFYRKQRDVRWPSVAGMSLSPAAVSVSHRSQRNLAGQPAIVNEENWLSTAYEDLLAKHVPPSLLVDEVNELVHCFGEARKLLSPPEGKPSNDVLKMLDHDLRVAVKSATHRAKQEDSPVTYQNVRVSDGDDVKTYCVSVEPYRRADKPLFLITIESTKAANPIKAAEYSVEGYGDRNKGGKAVNSRNEQLQRELNYTRETLQATVEELESSNEELQATNEELIASNEELHSVNEELYTVNREHIEKIEELTEVSGGREAERVRNATATLTQISQELPDFAYSVSHDLQTPLRQIIQSTQVLETAVEDGNESAILQSSKVVRNSATHLRTMIDGLLSYSLINTSSNPLTSVDLATSINGAIIDANNSAEMQARVHYDADLPKVLGDANQLKQLFYHLIDNAVKYRSDDPPEVRITCAPFDDHYRISLIDNGIGIDKKNAEHIFTMFHRLGVAENVPGAGVGLAICRRIILRHRGRIWLDPDTEKGTLICFTLLKMNTPPNSTMVEMVEA